MRTHRLETVDGFIVFDLDDAPTAVGITRLAPKILVDGVEILARATTYAFARFGVKAGGASAAINAPPDKRDRAAAAYVAEIQPLVASRTFLTDPGTGLTEADFAPLRASDPRPARLWADRDAARLLGEGVAAVAIAVAATMAAAPTDGIPGQRVVLDGVGAPTNALVAALKAAGAEIVAIGTAGSGKVPKAVQGEPLVGREEALSTPCDVLVTLGRTGCIDHEVAEGIDARLVVPAAPAPFTTKALAVLQRAGVVAVPDFISVAAPLLVAPLAPPVNDPVAAVRQAAVDHAGDGPGMWLAAAERAEEFLSTWQEKLPFGRPLA